MKKDWWSKVRVSYLQGLPSIEFRIWLGNTPAGSTWPGVFCCSRPSFIWWASCSSVRASPVWVLASFSGLSTKSGFRQVGHEYISLKPWSNLALLSDIQHLLSIIHTELSKKSSHKQKDSKPYQDLKQTRWNMWLQCSLLALAIGSCHLQNSLH